MAEANAARARVINDVDLIIFTIDEGARGRKGGRRKEGGSWKEGFRNEWTVFKANERPKGGGGENVI